MIHITVENDDGEVVYESDSASMEIALDKYYAFERHYKPGKEEDSEVEF